MRAFVLAWLCSGLSAWAMTPFKQTLDAKKNVYLQDGVFIGGKAGSGSSLLGVRRSFSAKAQIERIIVDLGDRNARPGGKKMGYFQASVDAQQNRVVLDLAQLKMTMVTEQMVRDTFKGSPYVKSVEFTLDPEDKAGTIVLNLKGPMRLEVFELLTNKKPARLVMDLTPASVTSLKSHQ